MPDGHAYALATSSLKQTASCAGPYEWLLRKAKISREQERLIGLELDFDADQLAEAWSEAADAALAGEVKSLRDAVAVLLVASHEMREGTDTVGYEAERVPSYLALGRAIRFLADEAGIDIQSFRPGEQGHPVYGLDPQLAANWHVDKVFRAGGQFTLRGDKVGICFTDRADDVSCTLLREFDQVDKCCLRDHFRAAITFSPEYQREAFANPKLVNVNGWWLTKRELPPYDIQPIHIGIGPVTVPGRPARAQAGHPDAVLLAAAAAFTAATDALEAYAQTFPGDIPDDDAKFDELSKQRVRLADPLCTIRAHTLAGHQARAAALGRYGGRWLTAPDDPDDAPLDRIQAALTRDLVFGARV